MAAPSTYGDLTAVDLDGESARTWGLRRLGVEKASASDGGARRSGIVRGKVSHGPRVSGVWSVRG